MNMDKSSRGWYVRKALKWGLNLSLLLLGMLIGALFIGFRQSPVLMRFVPQGGLSDGYNWELHEGLDFDIYYAQKADEETPGIGIYLGNMPNFFYDNDENISTEDISHERDRLLSEDVTWIILDEINPHKQPFFRETQLNYHHGLGFLYTKVHVWVYASEREELNGLLESLQTLQLKPMASFWQVLMSDLHTTLGGSQG